MLFGEGTSSDGNRVLPFRSALIGSARDALAEAEHTGRVWIQPLSIAYTGLRGLPLGRRDRPRVAWYGDLAWRRTSPASRGTAPSTSTVMWGEPVAFDEQSDRKAIARALEAEVRRGTAPDDCRGRGVRGPSVAQAGAQAGPAFLFGPKPAKNGAEPAAHRRSSCFANEYSGLTRHRESTEPAATAIPDRMSGTRKLHIKSYGCQMNVYDSQRMTDTMAREGFVETAAPEDADLIVLNTCHIREKAAEKVYSELGRMRKLKEGAARDGRKLVVAVAGCVAQAEGEEIIRRAPVVDLVLGPQNYHRLPDLLARAERGGKVVDTEFPVEDKFDHLAPASRAATRARGVTAFVTVQEGCDKFCTFCVVPYTRGAEVSRPVAQDRRARSNASSTPACAR